jgi:hypothetical protein
MVFDGMSHGHFLFHRGRLHISAVNVETNAPAGIDVGEIGSEFPAVVFGECSPNIAYVLGADSLNFFAYTMASGKCTVMAREKFQITDSALDQ